MVLLGNKVCYKMTYTHMCQIIRNFLYLGLPNHNKAINYCFMKKLL